MTVVSVPGTQPTKHLSTLDEEEGSDDDGDDTSPISGNGETFIMYIPSPSVLLSSPTWLRCVFPFAFGVFRGREGVTRLFPSPVLDCFFQQRKQFAHGGEGTDELGGTVSLL